MDVPDRWDICRTTPTYDSIITIYRHTLSPAAFWERNNGETDGSAGVGDCTLGNRLNHIPTKLWFKGFAGIVLKSY